MNARSMHEKRAEVLHLRSSDSRAERIRLFIEQQGRVTVTEVSEHFNVSPATARRAILILAEAGDVRRVHGGAVNVRQAPPELPILQRTRDQGVAKQRIARAAAALASDDETIFLGSGSTTLEVARALRCRRHWRPRSSPAGPAGRSAGAIDHAGGGSAR
jgi:DeoR family transcriptional regulator, aga operon transcriptional repressor